jgi:hypothetical protein
MTCKTTPRKYGFSAPALVTKLDNNPKYVPEGEGTMIDVEIKRELNLRKLTNYRDLGFIKERGFGWLCGNCTERTDGYVYLEYSDQHGRFCCPRCNRRMA